MVPKFFSSFQYGISMQTQCPCCVSYDYEVKQTNISHEAKQTPPLESGINSNTICNDTLPTV